MNKPIALAAAASAAASYAAAEGGGEAGAGLFAILLMLIPVALFGGFWLLWLLFMAAIVALGVLGTVFWILMLVDCVNRKFETESDKTTWVLIIALTHWLGATLYYFLIKRKTDPGLMPRTEEKQQNENPIK